MGFYGLTDKLAEFEKAMDYTLVGLQNTYSFLDDIIIVCKGFASDHLSYDAKCLKKLDEENLRNNFQKSHFAKTEAEWLGFKFTQTGIHIPKLKPLKRLRSFPGSEHYISKFIPHLA